MAHYVKQLTQDHHSLFRGTWLLGVALLLICQPSQAQTLLSDYLEYNLALQTSYLIEEDQAYNYQQVRQLKADAWTANKKPKMNFGFTGKTIWLKGSITSNLPDKTGWLLNIEYPPLDNIDIYILINDRLMEVVKSGDSQPFSNRQLASKEYLYRLSLKPADRAEYFLRIQSSGSMQVPLHLTPVNIYIKDSQVKEMLISALYGILLVMGIYNMFISILVKDKDYAIYVLWVFSTLFFVVSLNGEGFQVFWPNHPAVNNFALPIGFGCSGFFNTLFALKFMKIEHNRPTLSKVYYALLALYSASIAISTMGNYSTSIRVIFLVNFITLIFIAFSTVYLVIKKQRGAKIFLLSFSILLISAVVLSLSTAGIIPSNFISTHANQLAMVLESVIFSLALAKKIDYEKSLRIEKEQEVSALTKVANDNLNLYTQLFNNSPIAIFRFIDSGEIKSFNRAFTTMFPDIKDHISSHVSPTIFPTPEDLAFILNKLDNDNFFSSELKLTNSNHWISLTVIGYQDKHSPYPIFEGHAMDITQKKNADNKNKKLEEQKSKMLSRLVSGIAHEINTPVGTNITAITLLEGEFKDISQRLQTNSITKDIFMEFTTRCNSILEILNSNEHRTSLLVKRFKEVSIDQLYLSRSEFDIYQVINRHLSINSREHCHIELMKPEHPYIMNSYEKAFTLIIDNLIDNSIKFKEKQTTSINITLSHHNDRMTLHYYDDGPGIADAAIEHIFDPFYTSRPGDTHSTGLGLFVIYNLCKQLLDADIQLQPQPGFHLTIEFPCQMAPQGLLPG